VVRRAGAPEAPAASCAIHRAQRPPLGLERPPRRRCHRAAAPQCRARLLTPSALCILISNVWPPPPPTRLLLDPVRLLIHVRAGWAEQRARTLWAL
jgi:hypothetical protein